jgi:hypothetical protein
MHCIEKFVPTTPEVCAALSNIAQCASRWR